MRPAVFLRRAVAADVPALVALESVSSPHPWTSSQIADEVALDEGGTVLVLEGPCPSGDPLAGIRACGAFRLVLDELHVMNVSVAPASRRQGLARWLLRFALRRAGRAGARRALLEVRAGNHGARALYESLGFLPCGRRRAYYRDPVEDAVLMSRERLGAES